MSAMRRILRGSGGCPDAAAVGILAGGGTDAKSRGGPTMERRERSNLMSRVADVLGRIRAAAVRAGSSPGEVELVAVTKTVTVELARAVTDVGIFHLGESRPQELWRKAVAIDRAVWWHLI